MQWQYRAVNSTRVKRSRYPNNGWALRFCCMFEYAWAFVVKCGVLVSPVSGPGGAMRQKGSLSLGGMGIMGGLQRPGPSEFVYKGYNFLVTDRPTDATLPSYVEV